MRTNMGERGGKTSERENEISKKKEKEKNRSVEQPVRPDRQ